MSKRQRKPTSKVPSTLRRTPRCVEGLGVTSWTKFLKPMFSARKTRPLPTTEPRQPVGVELVRYDISYEPIAEIPSDYGVTQAQIDKIDQFSQALLDRQPSEMVDEIEALVAQFPQIPKVWNHLAVVYESLGRTEDVERVLEETYRRFPKYLFGITNFGMLRLRQGRAAEIPLILRGNFALHHLQGGRRTFHVSEILCFYSLLTCYFLEIDQVETAATYLDSLEELNPEHPRTRLARNRMLLKLSQVAFR